MGKSITSLFKKRTEAPPAPAHLGPWFKHPFGAFQFGIKLTSATPFEVHASTNLTQWTVIASVRATKAEIDYVDTEASKFNFRFYRVVSGGMTSNNVIGYANVPTPPGFTMVANPFQTTNNRISELLPSLPEGSMFNKFDNLKFRLSDNAFKQGKWSNPDETLSPGEGAIICNPTSDFRVLTFAGEVMLGKLQLTIPPGFSIRSSMVPQAGALHADLGFPFGPGDVVHVFDRDQQKYIITEYDGTKWATQPPVIGVGEAFWVGKTVPATWARDFQVAL